MASKRPLLSIYLACIALDILLSVFLAFTILFTDLYYLFDGKKQWELRKCKRQADHLVAQAQTHFGVGGHIFAAVAD